MIPSEYYLFLDTETSNKPEHWDKTDEQFWPFIVQVSWVIYDDEGHFVKEEDLLVNEDDYHISEESKRIHGITEADVTRQGIPRKKVLRKLSRDIRFYRPLVVGHFIELDLNMIKMATRRAGMKNFMKDKPVFCTMKATSDYINLPHRQYPQLEELYRMLFGKKMTRAHNALMDAYATSEVFFELLRRGEITKEVIEGQQLTEGPKKSKSRSGGCGLVLLLGALILIIQLMP